ncbi:unnamed protein product [Durusdinium trenchii]|uniref:J domain-containing protein n=1 Tax=Durusdinium trenchii TaxID=1381693 RepID=A0ABP0I0G9_9DINO
MLWPGCILSQLCQPAWQVQTGQAADWKRSKRSERSFGERVVGVPPVRRVGVLPEALWGVPWSLPILLRRHSKIKLRARKEATDPWSVLGLSPGASSSEVRRAFRARARLWHPDRGGDPERFQALSQAYAHAMNFEASTESAEKATSSVRRRAVEDEAERREPTLEDFLQWRRKQRCVPRVEGYWSALLTAASCCITLPRQTARRAAERERFASSSPRHGEKVWSAQRSLQDAVRQADTPELEAAWLREADIEQVRQQPKKSQSKSKETSDEHVGYRSVRSTSGTLTVPIFQKPDGARYYTSPLTSKRVAIP